MADRDESPEEMVARLQINFYRNSPHYREPLMRLVNCLTSGEEISFSGIERDIIVYALARTYQQQERENTK